MTELTKFKTFYYFDGWKVQLRAHTELFLRKQLGTTAIDRILSHRKRIIQFNQQNILAETIQLCVNGRIAVKLSIISVYDDP